MTANGSALVKLVRKDLTFISVQVIPASHKRRELAAQYPSNIVQFRDESCLIASKKILFCVLSVHMAHILHLQKAEWQIRAWAFQTETSYADQHLISVLLYSHLSVLTICSLPYARPKHSGSENFFQKSSLKDRLFKNWKS